MKTLNDSNPKGYPQPSDSDLQNHNISKLEEAEIFNNGPESPDERMSNGAVKGMAWLGGIFAVFAVGILLAWLCSYHHSPSTPYSARTTTTRTVNTQLNPAYASALPTASQKLVLIPTKITVIGQNAANSIASAASKASSKIASAVSGAAAQAPGTVAKVGNDAAGKVAASKADMDRIEREALEVIHGDFGNNPGRAKKLGADYAAVQARVNQMLHI